MRTLFGLIPFYGGGDCPMDQMVKSTLATVGSGTIDVRDEEGNTLLILACRHGCEVRHIALGTYRNDRSQRATLRGGIRGAQPDQCPQKHATPDSRKHGAVRSPARHPGDRTADESLQQLR